VKGRLSEEDRAVVAEALDVCDLIPPEIALTVLFQTITHRVDVAFSIFGGGRLLVGQIQALVDLWGDPVPVMNRSYGWDLRWVLSDRVRLTGYGGDAFVVTDRTGHATFELPEVVS